MSLRPAWSRLSAAAFASRTAAERFQTGASDASQSGVVTHHFLRVLVHLYSWRKSSCLPTPRRSSYFGERGEESGRRRTAVRTGRTSRTRTSSDVLPGLAVVAPPRT